MDLLKNKNVKTGIIFSIFYAGYGLMWLTLQKISFELLVQSILTNIIQTPLVLFHSLFTQILFRCGILGSCSTIQKSIGFFVGLIIFFVAGFLIARTYNKFKKS